MLIKLHNYYRAISGKVRIVFECSRVFSKSRVAARRAFYARRSSLLAGWEIASPPSAVRNDTAFFGLSMDFENTLSNAPVVGML